MNTDQANHQFLRTARRFLTWMNRMDRMGPAQASGPAILCLGFILYILFIHVKSILAIFGCGTAALCSSMANSFLEGFEARS